MAKSTISKPARFLSALVRTAYLPQELPPAITTRYFADFCAKNFNYLKSQQASLLKTTTNYETFTAPRAKSGRRNLSLVHPLAQTNVNLVITQHRKKIRELISKSGVSLYNTDENLKNFRAFSGLDFNKRNALQAKSSSEYPFILSADISRFFYTIYTHSVPWAAIGKEKSKHWLITDRKRLTAHWSDQLDRALQACQSRETFGIPVGPDTSRIIAEILFAGIESDEQLAPLLKGRIAFRLVDDLSVGFETEEDAYRALAALRNALWKFNLQLNEEKTSVSPSRYIMRERWELDHEAFQISDVDVGQQAIELARFFELTFHFCASSKTDTPALWTCRRISQLKNIKENFELILDGLFRLAREFPRCMTYVASILINNQDFCSTQEIKKRVERWCRSTIKTHIRHGHDFEVAWSLVVCGVLKIKLHQSDLETNASIPNPTVFALLGLLHQHKLLTFPLSTWPWRAKFKRAGVFDEYWLPFYEAVRRRWTNDQALIGMVKADPIMSKMLASNVTFLEDQIFDATQINIGKRLFRPQGAQIRTATGIAKYRKILHKAGLKDFGEIKITVEDLDY